MTGIETHYVLVDYENVQPKSLEELVGHPVKVIVFVGSTQSKIPFDLAQGLQLLGEHAEYKKINGTGRNALDFHIAFYLGELVDKYPKASFYVISRDKGFDPLIRHLQRRDVKATRSRDLAELPFLQIAVDRPEQEQLEAIVRNLASRGQSRPRKTKTLGNTINTLFSKKLTPDDLEQLIKRLENRGFIKINNSNGNVTYNLPSGKRTEAP